MRLIIATTRTLFVSTGIVQRAKEPIALKSTALLYYGGLNFAALSVWILKTLTIPFLALFRRDGSPKVAIVWELTTGVAEVFLVLISSVFIKDFSHEGMLFRNSLAELLLSTSPRVSKMIP